MCREKKTSFGVKVLNVFDAKQFSKNEILLKTEFGVKLNGF